MDLQKSAVPATPDTCAVAMEVPERIEYPNIDCVISVLRISSPGAAMSIDAPKFEFPKCRLLSSDVTEITVFNAAGKYAPGCTAFPAAATMIHPLLYAY